MTGRGWRLIRRDPLWLAMLAFQPVFLGLIICLSQFAPTRVESLWVFAAAAAVWLGLNNTVREVVRERRHYVRERMSGVTPTGYLLSKVGLFTLVGAAQVLVLQALVRYGNCLDERQSAELAGWSAGGVFAALLAAYFAAMLLGLAASAAAPTQEWAVAALPLMILPQLLLTAEATGEPARYGHFHSAAYLPDPTRARDWTHPRGTEAASLLTFTRPAAALLRAPPEGRPAGDWYVLLVNAIHLTSLAAVSGAVLWTVFAVRESRWLLDHGTTRQP
jgi:hypothetical protein